MMPQLKITKKEQERLNRLPIDLHSDESICRRCLKLLGDTMEYNCKPGEYVKKIKKNNIRLYIVLDTIPRDSYALIALERNLEKLCDLTNFKMSEIYIDYAVRCSLPKNIWAFSTVNRKSIVHNCRVYINSEISRLKPEVVLLMGEISLQSILKQYQIRQWHNKLIKHRELNSYVIPIAVQKNRLEFSDDILKNIQTALKTPIVFNDYKKQFVLKESQLKALIQKLKKVKSHSLDIETSTLDEYAEDAHVLGISISIDGKTGYFVPVQKIRDNQDELERTDCKWELGRDYWNKLIWASFKELLERPDIILIMHNAGFDYNYLVQAGFDLKGTLYDTMIANSVLFDTANGLKPLSYLHTDFGGYDDELDDELPDNLRKKYGFRIIRPPVLADYACFDGLATTIIYKDQQRVLRKHPVKDLIPELMQLRKNLSDMELRGCRIDVEYAKKLRKEFQTKLNDIHAELRVLLDVEDINLNSNPQLMTAFYRDGKSSLSYFVEKAKKKPSTDKKLLKFILPKIKKYPVKTKKEQQKRDNLIRSIELLSEYRKYSKYVSTYLDPFINKNINGYYHPYFKVHTVVTGRLASNMQQLPREGGLRDCVFAESGYDLVELDFSQAEMRVAAEMSGDAKLLAILNDRTKDIHSEIGHISIRKPDGSQYDKIDFVEGEISEKIRPQAKIVGFSILYGKTEMGLSEDLNCTPQEARKVIDYLLDGFPGLREMIERLQSQVETDGYIDTLFGRRLWIPEGLSDDPYTISEAHRYAVNYPVQSASSDILVLALNRLVTRIVKEKWKAFIILTVHDSVLFNVHKSQTKRFVKMAREEMERAIPQLKKVKMFADAKVGERWGGGMSKVK